MRRIGLVLAMLFLLCSFAYADEVTVTGTLTRTVAIGGETTGWGVKLDSPMQIEGRTFDLIEIDLDGKKINLLPFEDMRVKVTGELVKRTGIERVYWVIVVKDFSWDTSALSAGIVLVSCSDNCHSQLATCDQGCQYIKDDAQRLRCQNRCLSGYFHCLKRCDGRSETPGEFKPCSQETILDGAGAGCREYGEACTLYGTPCCDPYSCQGKFPNTTCQ